jgi:hypothetical protein
MSPTVHSTTQPVLEHAYAATCTTTSSQVNVVYRGHLDGRPIVAHTDGNEYYAKRSSPENEAPCFEFSLNDKVIDHH